MSSHGRILTDELQPLPCVLRRGPLFTFCLTNSSIPPFVESRSGLQKQRWVWDETREEFEAKASDIRAVYAMLDLI